MNKHGEIWANKIIDGIEATLPPANTSAEEIEETEDEEDD